MGSDHDGRIVIVEHPLGSGAKAAKASAPPRDLNRGTIISVHGSVVDVRFDERLPTIHSILRTGAKKEIVIEALAQRPRGNAR